MAELLYRGTTHSLDYAVVRRAEEHAKSSHTMALSADRLIMRAVFLFQPPAKILIGQRHFLVSGRALAPGFYSRHRRLAPFRSQTGYAAKRSILRPK